MSSKSAHLTKVALILGATIAVAGCNTAQKHIGEEDPFLGEAVKYDMAIQTINPEPVYPPSAAHPGDNGARGEAAVKRYRTDAVKQVEARQTTAGTGGSTSH